MNAQFKKGVLDLIALHILNQGKMTAYDVLVKLRDSLEVNENTIYPLLRRLENDDYITYEKIQGEMGAPRKVFLLTNKGVEQLNVLKGDWVDFFREVNRILGGDKHE